MIIQQLHYNQSAAHPMKMYLFYLYNSTDLVLSTVVSTSYFNRSPQTAMTTTFVQRTSTLHRRRRRHHLWPCWKTFVNSFALTIAALVVVVTATAAAVTKRQPKPPIFASHRQRRQHNNNHNQQQKRHSNIYTPQNFEPSRYLLLA